MLHLKRKVGQGVRIGADIRVSVKRISATEVTLSFEAPENVTIWRDEIQAEGDSPTAGTQCCCGVHRGREREAKNGAAGHVCSAPLLARVARVQRRKNDAQSAPESVLEANAGTRCPGLRCT